VSARARVAAVALLALAAASGCDLVRGLFGEARDEKRVAIGESLRGLQAKGAGPVLSWDAVPGAASYAVIASGGKAGGRWSWIGKTTQVPYGVVSASDPAMPSLERMAAPTIVTSRQGVTYKWFVTALDRRGRLLSHSPMSTFAGTGKAKPAVAAAQRKARTKAPPTGAPPAPGAAPAPPAAKTLVTAEKIKAFIIYQREISQAGGLVAGTFGRAATGGRPGGGDPGVRALAARGQAALAKSGLTQQEATALSGILTPYFSKRVRARAARAALAGSKPGAGHTLYQQRLAEGDQARAAFAAAHGRAALAAADSHEQEYAAIMEAAVDALLKPRR
jgi:hypothetical protein